MGKRTLKELRDGLNSVLAVDRARRAAVSRAASLLPEGAFEEIMKRHDLAPQDGSTEDKITGESLDVLRNILTELVEHDSPAAVRVIRKLFSTDVPAFRLEALGTLAAMPTPAARKAIAKRLSWFSSATDEEKALVRSLLDEHRTPPHDAGPPAAEQGVAPVDRCVHHFTLHTVTTALQCDACGKAITGSGRELFARICEKCGVVVHTWCSSKI